MPLTVKGTFEAVLEKGNRLQIQKLIRRQFKMEQNQVLRVCASPKRIWEGGPKVFLCQDGQTGTNAYSQVNTSVNANKGNPNLEGYIFDLWLEPA